MLMLVVGLEACQDESLKHTPGEDRTGDLPRADGDIAAKSQVLDSDSRSIVTQILSGTQRCNQTALDTFGVEPTAFRVRSGCNTITACAHPPYVILRT